MTARKIFSIIGLVISLFLIGNMFLPYYSTSYSSISFWEFNGESYQNIGYTNIILLIELIILAVVYVLQLCGVFKTARFAYFTIGYYLTSCVANICLFSKHEAMSNTAIGFWLGFIFAVVLLIITVIGNFIGNESKPKAVAAFDPTTGQPINQ